MTLATDIYIQTRLTHKEVYDFFSHQIGPRDDGLFILAEDTIAEDGTRCLRAVHGQGLSAELEVYYAAGGKALADWRAEWLEDDQDALPLHNIRVSLETHSGYSDNLGNCTDLHARFIIDFYRSVLESRGEHLYWNNEYSDVISKDFDGMTEFLEAGDEYVQYFHDSVMPMLANIDADPEILHRIFE